MTDTYIISGTGKPVIVKDPAANLDYTFDWTAWLLDSADSIDSATATINNDSNPSDNTATISDQQVSGSSQYVVWVEGGTVGQQYTVDCTITTVQGRTDSRRIYITIKDR